MDIGFVNKDITHIPKSKNRSKYSWLDILVPGELKNNSDVDIPSKAWISLATYAREVLSNQDARCFTLGFTLCGSMYGNLTGSG